MRGEIRGCHPLYTQDAGVGFSWTEWLIGNRTLNQLALPWNASAVPTSSFPFSRASCRARRILLLGLCFAAKLVKEVEDEVDLCHGRGLARGCP
jgi:hypothetical protein